MIQTYSSAGIAQNPMLSEVVIQDGRIKNGLSKYIHLKTDGETFILSWELPISYAWLVMVDECILRIDYLYDDRKLPWSQCCFPVGLNFKPFLKLPRWDSKSIVKGENCCTYNFT